MSQEHNVINPIPSASEAYSLPHMGIGSPEGGIALEGPQETSITTANAVPEGSWIALPKQLCRAFLSGRPVCNRIPCKYFHGDEHALRAAREAGHNAYRPADGKTCAIDEDVLANMSANPDPKQVRLPDLLPGRVNSLAPKLDWPVDNIGRPTNTNPNHLARGSICATYYKGLACKLGVACPFLHSPPEYRMMDREVCAYHREGICGKGSQCAYFHGTDEERAKLVEMGARVYNAITKEAVPPSALASDVRENPRWWEERPERLAELRQLRAAMPDSVPARPPDYPGTHPPTMYMSHTGLPMFQPPPLQAQQLLAPAVSYVQSPLMMAPQPQGGFYFQSYQQPISYYNPNPQLPLQPQIIPRALPMQQQLQHLPIQQVLPPMPQQAPHYQHPQAMQYPGAQIDPRYLPQPTPQPTYFGFPK